MKSILLFLILLPVFGLGQKDTIWISDSLYITNAKSAANYGSGTIIFSYKQDTIPVIMLVCDTADVNWVGMGFSFADDGLPYKKSTHVWWQFGYEVWNIKSNFGSVAISSYGNIIPHQYLNSDKKPLPKSTIVWLTKPINQ